MTAYILSAAAEADMRGVVRYTRKQWGDAQARRYVLSLEQRIIELANGRGAYKDMSALFPALRMMRCEHHFVFCLPRTEMPALIVAIFHERMDLITRVIDRLNE